MYVFSIISGKTSFSKKKHRLESKICTSNQTVQNFKECQRTVDKQVFLEILPIAPHILKSLIQFQGNQHHFHIHFHVILRPLFMCLHTKYANVTRKNISSFHP